MLFPPCSAKRLYDSSVRGTLEAAGVQHTLHITQRAGHASEIVAGLDLSSVDALVFMGGDGTAHEALQACFWVPGTSHFLANLT